MILRSKHLGALRPARVLRHYIDPVLEVPVADVCDSFGAVHMQGRYLTLGGGDADSYDYTPPPNDDPAKGFEDSGDVMLALGDGARPHPLIVGTVYS